jgi:hypothetical protein
MIMPQLTPVDYDPFAPGQAPTQGFRRLTPVDHDPFAGAAPETLPTATVHAPEESPWYSNLGEGVKHGVESVAQGLEQLNRRAVPIDNNPELVKMIGQTESTPQFDERVRQENADFDAGAGQTGWGVGGNLLGNVIATAPLGMASIPARALPVAGATGLARLAPYLEAILRGSATGAAGAATQPVLTKDNGEPTLSDLITGQNPGPSFAEEKMKQAGLGALVGGAVPVLARPAAAIIEKLLPKNVSTLPFRAVAGRKVTEAAQDAAPPTPARAFMDESDQLSAATGVPFTPGQSTGSKGLTMLEQKLRQSSRTADQVFEHDNNATAALDTYITRMLRNTSQNARSPEETGDLVRTAIRSKVGQVEQMRRQVAEQQYGAIRQLIGGKPIIPADNLRAALSDVASEYGSIATPGAKALSRFADKTSSSELGDVQNLMKLRSYLSKVAGGQAKISGEMVDRKIAASMLSAIDNDLDAGAQQLGGRVGDMLKAANQNYKNFSGQMEYLQRSPLGKLLGEDVTNAMTGGSFNTVPAEKVLERVRKMTPSEASATRVMMQDVSPEAWQALKRQVIEDALEQARLAAPSQGANTLAMQPTAFVRALNGQHAQGQAWAKALLEPGELTQLNNAFKAAQRLGDKTGFNFSGTASALEGGVEKAARDAGNVTPLGVVSRVIGGASSRLTSKKLAAAMVDPDGRKALLKLSQLPPQSKQAASLLGYITALSNSGADSEEDQNQSGHP